MERLHNDGREWRLVILSVGALFLFAVRSWAVVFVVHIIEIVVSLHELEPSKDKLLVCGVFFRVKLSVIEGGHLLMH